MIIISLSTVQESPSPVISRSTEGPARFKPSMSGLRNRPSPGGMHADTSISTQAPVGLAPCPGWSCLPLLGHCLPSLAGGSGCLPRVVCQLHVASHLQKHSETTRENSKSGVYACPAVYQKEHRAAPHTEKKLLERESKLSNAGPE